METLKYKVITSEKQYDKYAEILEDLVFLSSKTKQVKEEIALLTLLIETYDASHNRFDELDPVQLLKSLMKDHQLKSIDLANKIKVSPGLISDIMNYKKGFSKDVIRKLAIIFKMSHEAFNRAYELRIPRNEERHAKKKLAGIS
jgi:HTH-type transcriptional regulator/antitoxin HigA